MAQKANVREVSFTVSKEVAEALEDLKKSLEEEEILSFAFCAKTSKNQNLLHYICNHQPIFMLGLLETMKDEIKNEYVNFESVE